MKLFIGLPCYNAQISLNTFYSLQKLILYLFQNKVPFKIYTIPNESLISRARNVIASKMLNDPEADFTHLFFIDSDIGFEVQNFIRLKDLNKDIACGLYPKKIIYWNKLQDQLKKNKEITKELLKESILDFNINFIDPNNIVIENGFAKVKHGATGFMLIKKDVLTKMIKNYPEIKYNAYQSENNREMYDFFKVGVYKSQKDLPRYLSEDYFFSQLWLDMGGEIWADLVSPLSHFGSYNYEGKAISMIDIKK